MISKKYSELNDQLQNMNTYIFSTPEKQTELGLDAAQLKQFDTYKTQYQQSFAIYIDPAKKTHAATGQKKRVASPLFLI